MPYPHEERVRSRITGMWTRRKNPNSPDFFFKSSVLRQEDEELCVKLFREGREKGTGTLFMVFSNRIKNTERHPDTYLHLYVNVPKEEWAAKKQSSLIQSPYDEDAPF